MKRVFSFIILIVAILFITIITVYALSHKGIREDVPTKNFKKVEKVTSNISNNTLSEVFNVQLNNTRHKVKMEYNVTFEKKNKTIIDLVIYIDGKVMFQDKVSEGITAKKVENLFLNENINSYVRLSENNIKIIENDKKQYLVINVGYYSSYGVLKYFIFDDRGKSLNDEGIIVLDESLKYTDSDKKELDIYYDIERKTMAKIDKNNIYALEYKNEDKNGILEEYKYSINNNKLNKELLNTYENIKLVSGNNSKK